MTRNQDIKNKEKGSDCCSFHSCHVIAAIMLLAAP